MSGHSNSLASVGPWRWLIIALRLCHYLCLFHALTYPCPLVFFVSDKCYGLARTLFFLVTFLILFSLYHFLSGNSLFIELFLPLSSSLYHIRRSLLPGWPPFPLASCPSLPPRGTPTLLSNLSPPPLPSMNKGWTTRTRGGLRASCSHFDLVASGQKLTTQHKTHEACISSHYAEFHNGIKRLGFIIFQ